MLNRFSRKHLPTATDNNYDDRGFQMRVSALFNAAVIDEPLAFHKTNSSVGRGQI
jgi:hypothetical protein